MAPRLETFASGGKHQGARIKSVVVSQKRATPDGD